MSTNSRYRERKYNSTDNDRLSRILSQPVQSWEKKWAPSSRSKSHPIFKWVKSDKTIVFEDEDDEDEDDDDDDDEEDKDQVMTEAVKDASHATSQIETQRDNEPTSQAPNVDTTTETVLNKPTTAEESVESTTSLTNDHNNTGLFTSTTAQNHNHTIVADHDEEPTHTPKLSDVPDVDPDQIMEDKENNADDLNDASRHPAFAPHIHPQLTDDDEPMVAYNQNQSNPIFTGTEHTITPVMDSEINNSTLDQSITTTVQEQPISTTIHHETNDIAPITTDLDHSMSTTTIDNETIDNASDQTIPTTAINIDTTEDIATKETSTVDTNTPAATEHDAMDTTAPSASTDNTHDDPINNKSIISTDATELPATPTTTDAAVPVEPSPEVQQQQQQTVAEDQHPDGVPTDASSTGAPLVTDSNQGDMNSMQEETRTETTAAAPPPTQ